MKKTALIISAAILLATACGCTDINAPESSQTESTTASHTESTTTSQTESTTASQTENTTAPQESKFTGFKPGIWKGEKQYYIFNEDMQSGSTLGYALGVGVSFNYYVLSDSELMFHFAYDGDNNPAEITEKTENSVTLDWSGYRTETLEFVTDESADSYDFPEIAANAFKFKPGIWKGADRYYYFREDLPGGSTRDFSTGIGVSFSYELDKNIAVFHLGAADVNSVAVLSMAEENSVILDWEDGRSEVLTFVSEGDFDSLVFTVEENP